MGILVESKVSFNSDPQTHKERESGKERETHTKKHTDKETHVHIVSFCFLREFLASYETAAKKLPQSP